MRAIRNSWALALGLVVAALANAGCSSTSSCSRDADTAEVTEGWQVFGNTYISAPNDSKNRGPWAYFPPARTLIFEHHLPGIPYQIAVWLAFQPEGTLAPSAGNLSIRQFSDDTQIAIKNDTCSEYWAWVEASLPVYSNGQGAAGASGEEAMNAAGAPGEP